MSKTKVANIIMQNESNERFKKAQKQNLESVKKVVDNYVSSSEDEEDLDETTILKSIYQHYKTADNEKKTLEKTANFLESVLHSGSAACLICIGSIKRSDAIWSCVHCFCIFHLNCIKRWANDSISQLKTQASQNQNDQGYYNNLGEFVPPKKHRPIQWCCPQCRVEYTPNERPDNYVCFCGKELNPASQPWLVPHSCGEMCSKPLLPDCGHKCMLLCHPGPCPPCAQYAYVSCLCRKSQPKSVRCANKSWQCEKPCKERLSCGEHLCNQPCHMAGKCPPCSSTSMQPCQCGNEVKERKCSDLKWHCKKVCNKKFQCGLHSCKKICHSGDCGDCPLGLPRSCPCGKTSKVGPCTETIDTCGDTCQKLLSCGLHTCTQRCHRGECNLCLVIIKKKCRCGLHTKELPCSKEYTCETKCKQTRDCGKHTCSRKCCDGNCPPCDKVCGKILSCKKHKCQSVCHDGLCYPCEKKSQVNCRCGKTSRTVPCGRERTARINCLEPCRMPRRCHHEVKHRCHKNECPPCNQQCGLPNDTQGCGHTCKSKCHAAIRVALNDQNDSLPTKAIDKNQKYTYKALPHPRCEDKVTVTCIGGHEIAEWPCWNSKPSSCQRKCNRLLRCGNHKCSLICHEVSDIQNMNEQPNCAPCQEGCTVARPNGCVHPCPRACHPPPCSPCNSIIRTKCHCGLTQVVYNCSEFYAVADNNPTEIIARQERLRSCGDRCQKNLPCGHRCRAICHSGSCPNPEACNKKVRIFCECKTVKFEVSCDKYRSGQKTLPCNEKCTETKLKLQKEMMEANERQRQLEAERNRAEVEQFEKKFNKRKPRERKINEIEKPKRNINWTMIGIYGGILLAIILSVIVAIYGDN